ncbi:MAG: SGNH/GDSL hydrolase family protein [Pirellulales bacterium]|nr:SGNH/GDSL hydrolase family protein [Pirellulales bacterium]
MTCYLAGLWSFNPMDRSVTASIADRPATALPGKQTPLPRTGRGRWFRASALLLGLALGMAATEVALRALDIHPSKMLIKRYLMGNDVGSIYWCYPDNPHGEFRPVPVVSYGNWVLKIMKMPRMVEIPLSRLRETPWCVEYHTSPQKLRDREFGPRPSGVLRVAGVGDSFAAGEGVPIERSLFKRIETELGTGYEVANAAQPGHGTRDELERLRFLASKLDCQRGIVVWIANDVGRTPELEARQDYVNDLVLLRDERLQDDDQRWYRGRSRLIDLVDSRLHLWSARDDLARVTADTIQWYRDCYDPTKNGENLRQFEADLAAIAAVPGCQSVLVLYPMLEGIESGYPLADVHAYVARAATRAGLPVLDLAPVFRGERSSDLWVHPVDHHPNGHAHELAAAAIVDWLRRDVPGFLERPAD